MYPSGRGQLKAGDGVKGGIEDAAGVAEKVANGFARAQIRDLQFWHAHQSAYK